MSGLSLRLRNNKQVQQVMDLISPYISTPAGAAVAVSSSVAALTLTWAILDFNAWVNFGTGGTSPNLSGYWKISKFRFFRALSGDSLADASRLPNDGPSYIQRKVPRREGSPPKIVSRTLPQRQVPVPLDASVHDRLHGLCAKYAKKYPELLILDKSITEGHTTDAIYAREELPGRKKATQDKVLGNEIAHVHPQESSLHIWMTKADTKKVVEAGWGLRFPLASLGICDEGWTFIYAPRTMAEVDLVEEFVRAGIGHLTGEIVS